MELYTLDTLNRRDLVIDQFESLIWTERYAAWGDFELELYSTPQNRSIFTPGKRLVCRESYRVMSVETIVNTTDDQGLHKMKVTGRSLEAMLEDRVAKDTFTNTTSEPKWKITGLPAAIVRTLYHDICGTGNLNSKDMVAGVNETTFLPAGNIPEPPDSLSVALEPATLYDAIQSMCVEYEMGFRLIRNPDNNQLYFNIYMGDDRTSGQSTLDAVIFSPALNNLKNTTEITSIDNFKNIAYVFSPVGTMEVIRPGTDPLVTGFDRRIVLVNASDITDPLTKDTEMSRRGQEALSQHRSLYAFDGEIPQDSSYIYGVHYNLGDLVQFQGADGGVTNMRVTEQIFVSDREGDRSYPTLSVDLVVTPGSWAGWNFDQVWQDLGTTTYWANI